MSSTSALAQVLSHSFLDARSRPGRGCARPVVLASRRCAPSGSQSALVFSGNMETQRIPEKLA